MIFRNVFHIEANMFSSRIAVAPKLEVMIKIVLRKSTFRPLASVKWPSSKTCNKILKTSGWAFLLHLAK